MATMWLRPFSNGVLSGSADGGERRWLLLITTVGVVLARSTTRPFTNTQSKPGQTHSAVGSRSSQRNLTAAFPICGAKHWKARRSLRPPLGARAIERTRRGYANLL